MGHIGLGRERGVGGAAPVTLDLPEPWRSRGWKVKIYDRERLEPPHVTILNRARAWRFNLRSETFLNTKPDPKEVPNLTRLREAWDGMFPENPISSEEPGDE